MTNKNCHVSSEYKYIAQYITQYITQLNCDIYRDIDQSLIQGHAWMLKHSTCRQKILVKKNVSRIRDSPTGIPYRRKLRYPKFNFILFPLLPIFSIMWASRFCACHSKFDWTQFFPKNFIIWQKR